MSEITEVPGMIATLGIDPVFTRFKVANEKIERSNFIKRVRGDMIDYEIKRKNKELRSNRRKLDEVIKILIFRTSYLDWILIRKVGRNMLAEYKANVIEKQKRKLLNLGYGEIEIRNEENITRRNKYELTCQLINPLDAKEIKSKKSVYNLSNVILSDLQMNVLEKGLKFGIKTNKTDEFEICSNRVIK